MSFGFCSGISVRSDILWDGSDNELIFHRNRGRLIGFSTLYVGARLSLDLKCCRWLEQLCKTIFWMKNQILKPYVEFPDRFGSIQKAKEVTLECIQYQNYLCDITEILLFLLACGYSRKANKIKRWCKAENLGLVRVAGCRSSLICKARDKISFWGNQNQETSVANLPN